MSIDVLADAPYYIKQSYHHTPQCCPEHEDCITSVYFQIYPLHLGKSQKIYFITQYYLAADLCIPRKKGLLHCCWYC